MPNSVYVFRTFALVIKSEYVVGKSITTKAISSQDVTLGQREVTSFLREMKKSNLVGDFSILDDGFIHAPITSNRIADVYAYVQSAKPVIATTVPNLLQIFVKENRNNSKGSNPNIRYDLVDQRSRRMNVKSTRDVFNRMNPSAQSSIRAFVIKAAKEEKEEKDTELRNTSDDKPKDEKGKDDKKPEKDKVEKKDKDKDKEKPEATIKKEPPKRTTKISLRKPKEDKRALIVIKFDGVISDTKIYEEKKDKYTIGLPIPDTVKWLRELGNHSDYKICIYSDRFYVTPRRTKAEVATQKKNILDWLEAHKIPYHDLVSSPPPTFSLLVAPNVFPFNPDQAGPLTLELRKWIAEEIKILMDKGINPNS